MAKLEGRWDKLELPIIFILSWSAHEQLIATLASGELLKYRIRLFIIAGFYWDTSLPYYTTILGDKKLVFDLRLETTDN